MSKFSLKSIFKIDDIIDYSNNNLLNLQISIMEELIESNKIVEKFYKSLKLSKKKVYKEYGKNILIKIYIF